MRLLASLVLAAGLAGAEPAVPAQDRATPTREQVQEVVEQLKQDPNLSGKRLHKTLRLKDPSQAQAPKPTRSLPWLIEFLRWFADASRLLVWVLGALALALLLVGLRHWIKWRSAALTAPAPALPSHVRDLDIRRESLPADIGAAVRVLWDQGQVRAALALLYRGALSRLVHTHAVPIGAACTEGDCVRLAAGTLARERSDFFARLVQAWQLAVYGSRPPASAEVLALCAGFDAQLGAPDAAATRPATAAANP